MNVMRKKLGKNGGFTLVEMLIVVAIIAILIAVSIPLVNDSLEKARDATDQANERAAKAEASLVYMEVVNDPVTDGNTYGDLKEALLDEGLIYDAVCGNMFAYGTAPDNEDHIKYGKCTGTREVCENTEWMNTNGAGATHQGMFINVTVDDTTGTYEMEWIAP